MTLPQGAGRQEGAPRTFTSTTFTSGLANAFTDTDASIAAPCARPEAAGAGGEHMAITPRRARAEFCARGIRKEGALASRSTTVPLMGAPSLAAAAAAPATDAAFSDLARAILPAAPSAASATPAATGLRRRLSFAVSDSMISRCSLARRASSLVRSMIADPCAEGEGSAGDVGNGAGCDRAGAVEKGMEKGDEASGRRTKARQVVRRRRGSEALLQAEEGVLPGLALLQEAHARLLLIHL